LNEFFFNTKLQKLNSFENKISMSLRKVLVLGKLKLDFFRSSQYIGSKWFTFG